VNHEDRRIVPNQEAVVEYGPGEFRVIRAGAYVLCATTHVAIRLQDLKYWSIDLQEAYASPEATLIRIKTQMR
jgi:hypothetical protein